MGYKIKYDKFADVLYINRLNPTGTKPAITTEFDKNYIAVRRTEGKIQGLTVDGYMARQKEGDWKNSMIIQYLPDLDTSLIEEAVNRKDQE